MNEERQMTAGGHTVVKQQAADAEAAPPPRNSALELFLLGVLFSIVASVSVAVTWKWQNIRAKSARAEVVLPATSPSDLPWEVPDFSLIDKNGTTVTRADLMGQVWVANFFFTNCPSQCPAMTLRMAQIQRALPEEAAAKLVSITVDPERDSPDVLAEYAKTFHARDDRWLFLTGDKQAIIGLARQGFKLPASDNPNEHSMRLTLVDREGLIRGYFNSTDEKSVTELQEQLRKLLGTNQP